MIFRKKLFLLCALLLFVNSLSAQQETLEESPSLFNKNAVLVSVGSVLVYNAAAGYYERTFGTKNENANTAFFARVGFGGLISWGGDGTFFAAQGGILTGARKNSHFEGALGLAVFSEDVFEDSNVSMSGTAAYRYQKPTGGLIFRAGAAFPETLFFGFGYSFR